MSDSPIEGSIIFEHNFIALKGMFSRLEIEIHSVTFVNFDFVENRTIGNIMIIEFLHPQ